MIRHRERPGLGRHSLLTAAALLACLAATGCKGIAGSALLNATPTNSSAVVAPKPLTGPPADPFAGTPADHWADGAAGIVIPAAKPIAGFTKAQVALAYQWTGKLLVAANMDKQTMAGGAPTAYANLLTHNERTWFLSNLNKKGTDKNGLPLSTRATVVSFAPGSTQLIGNTIKVHGTVSAKAATRDGAPELDVHVDYLFAYAVEPPGHPEEWMRLVNEQSLIVAFGRWQGAATTFEPWLNSTGIGGIAGASCGSRDGYIRPDWPTLVARDAPSVAASGKPVNPYAAGQPRSVVGCEATTGT